MAFFNIQNIDSRVQATLNKRRTYNDKQFIAGRAPWIRMVSNAVILNAIEGWGGLGYQKEDTSVRQRYILYGGRSGATSYETIYHSADNRPLSGITGMSVTSTGDFGALRKAEINFTCPSYEEFVILEQLYLHAGIYLLVEWGWSHDSSTTLTDIGFTDIAATQANIFKKAVSSGGTYDGFLGKIAGYSWVINEQGHFECTVKITTTGEFLLNAPLDNASKNIYTKWKFDDESKESTTNETSLKRNMEVAIHDVIDALDSGTQLISYSAAGGDIPARYNPDKQTAKMSPRTCGPAIEAVIIIIKPNANLN